MQTRQNDLVMLTLIVVGVTVGELNISTVATSIVVMTIAFHVVVAQTILRKRKRERGIRMKKVMTYKNKWNYEPNGYS